MKNDKVSTLAKHFEKLSGEFEAERVQARTVAKAGNVELMHLRAMPKIEVWDSIPLCFLSFSVGEGVFFESDSRFLFSAYLFLMYMHMTTLLDVSCFTSALSLNALLP
jgi:hypothetical protein